MGMTTIRVPTELHDRISADAKAHGQTIAGRLEQLISEAERPSRFAEIRTAYASPASSADYREETTSWDSLAADGPDDD